MDVLTKHRATINFVDDVTTSKDEPWVVELQRKLAHIYIVWETVLCFTESEVRRLYRHFYHSSDERFMSLIKRTIPEEVSVSTRSTISAVRDACDICQRNAREL